MTDSLISLVKFGLVGILSTVIHATIFFVLVDVYYFSPTIATIPAFLGAVLVSYRLNHSWTFGAKGRHSYFFIRYFSVTLLGLALNISIMYVGTNMLHWNHVLCLGLVLMIVPAFNFLLNKYWGFVEHGE